MRVAFWSRFQKPNKKGLTEWYVEPSFYRHFSLNTITGDRRLEILAYVSRIEPEALADRIEVRLAPQAQEKRTFFMTINVKTPA